MHACPFRSSSLLRPHSVITAPVQSPSASHSITEQAPQRTSNKSVHSHLVTLSSQKQQKQNAYLLGPIRDVKKVHSSLYRKFSAAHLSTKKQHEQHHGQWNRISALPHIARMKTVRLLISSISQLSLSLPAS